MAKASSDSDTDIDVAPAFLTDAQAATFLGISGHQLYLHRRKGSGPPFVLHGARIRYPVAGLREWAASLPTFTSRAQAYAANPAQGQRRREATRRQWACTAGEDREARSGSPQGEEARRPPCRAIRRRLTP